MLWEWNAPGEEGLVYGFSSSKVIVSKEGLVYPQLSFLAEVGGSLGLFIGFSFLGLYDHLVQLIRFFRLEIFEFQ